jgi:hypothetical protein
MKFDILRSIGHNIADSLGSGCGFPIGFYFTDIFGEARRSSERCIIVDFLAGKVTSGRASSSLAGAIAKYADALADLCKKHNASRAMFRELTARYSIDPRGGPYVVVTVEDHEGHRAVDDYLGWGSRRVRILDHRGRIRRKPGRVPSN